MIVILLLTSAVSALTGQTASVVAIVLPSVCFDFVQGIRAQNAADAVRRSVAVQVSVLRDRKRIEVPMDRIVPGDVVALIAGDLVEFTRLPCYRIHRRRPWSEDTGVLLASKPAPAGAAGRA